MRSQCRVAPTSSHLITGVEQPRAGLVLGWVTSGYARQAEVKTDSECSGCLIEWLQRLGMVTNLGKTSTCLPGLSGLIDSIDHLKIMII